MSIRVLLVDDQPLLRLGFRLVLEAEDDLEVVGEAGDGHLLDDELYPRLFDDRYAINMYLNCVLLTKKVREALRTHEVLKGGDVDDWAFHVSTVATMLITKKVHPSHADIANADFASVPNERIPDLLPVVGREYQRGLSRAAYVPFSQVSSDKSISDAIVKRTESMLISSRWRQWPAAQIDEDAAILASDVFYRGVRRRG